MIQCSLVIGIGIICIIAGAFFGWYFTGHKYCVELENCYNLEKKDREIIRIYDVWMMNHALGRSVGNYLSEQNVRNVAIYGMSALGIRLYYELKNQGDVTVEFAMDQNPQTELPEVTICKLDMEPKVQVDAVIVTAIFSYDAIERDLKKRGYTKIFALDEILYKMLQI